MYEEPTSATLRSSDKAADGVDAIDATIAFAHEYWTIQNQGLSAQENGDHDTAAACARKLMEMLATRRKALSVVQPSPGLHRIYTAAKLMRRADAHHVERRTPMTRFARRSVRAARRHAGSTTRRTTRTGGGGSSGDDGPASPPACERRTVTPSVRRAR